MECRKCGICCRRMTSPPGYVAILAGIAWPNKDDIEMAGNLPGEAMDSLVEYIHGGMDDDSVPCCWLDAETNLCKWYDWRPSICREYEH